MSQRDRISKIVSDVMVERIVTVDRSDLDALFKGLGGDVAVALVAAFKPVGWYFEEDGVRDLVWDYEMTATDAEVERYRPVYVLGDSL